MLKIFKKNLIYLLPVFALWIVFMPLVVNYRQEIYDWYARVSSPKGYSPRTMTRLMNEGDSILKKSFDSLEAKSLSEVSKKSENYDLETYLNFMVNSCDYYKNMDFKDDIFYEPTWYEKHSGKWNFLVREKPGLYDKIFNKEDGYKKPEVPNLDPKHFWAKHVGDVLSALDYYKRAMHYSGPEIIVANKISKAAKAACRPEEVILAYTYFINNVEQYALEEITKDELTKKEMLSLREMQKKERVYEFIKNSPEKPKLIEYMEGLTILLSDTKLKEISPLEADDYYTKILRFLQGSTDPNQQWKEKEIRFKRGLLLFKLGKKDKKFYYKAMEQFQAASSISKETREAANSVLSNLIETHIFESELMEAKCNYYVGDYKKALTILKSMESKRGSLGLKKSDLEKELLHDFIITLRDTYFKLGRTQEADLLEE